MQIPVVNGIYADAAGDFRTSYPRNLVPVPKSSGVSQGHLRPAEGIVQTGTAIGPDRGAIVWNGVLHRVSGSKLCRITADGACTVLGDVGQGGPVTMDYSFDRLGIASAGMLFYWNGTTLSKVTDPDLGYVKDMKWIDGYFMTTDGVNLVTTDLNDPASVQTTHYGSAEADPDPIMAVDELRTEAYAFGRYTVEVFQNVGGTGFPFQRVEGAQVTKGIVGTHAYAPLGDTFVFVGSGRNEALGVYTMVPGNVAKVSTAEIDRLLRDYTDEELAAVVVETKVDRNHQHVLVHLPDRTLVYDTIGSQAAEEPLWFTLDSGVLSPSRYLARGLVWCYGQWNVGDPSSAAVGRLSSEVSTHWGNVVGWDFGVKILYNGGADALIHELELVGLPGRVAFGANPVIWTSYSTDGETWSQEKPVSAGMQGERTKRICWRRQGRLRHWRIQRFRGTSDAHISIARLEAQVEPLATKAYVGAFNG